MTLLIRSTLRRLGNVCFTSTDSKKGVTNIYKYQKLSILFLSNKHLATRLVRLIEKGRLQALLPGGIAPFLRLFVFLTTSTVHRSREVGQWHGQSCEGACKPCQVWESGRCQGWLVGHATDRRARENCTARAGEGGTRWRRYSHCFVGLKLIYS